MICGHFPWATMLCGPIGTGKTFLGECLAGEAGVPVVKLNNFREKWWDRAKAPGEDLSSHPGARTLHRVH